MHDTHCHLDAYDDSKAVIEAVGRSGMPVVWVGTTPANFPASLRLAEPWPNITVAPGLHPQDALRCRDQTSALVGQIQQPGTTWVGEVGLDNVERTADEQAAQREVFDAVLHACADIGDDRRVLTIHSRRAAADVLDALDSGFPRAVLHWFSGNDAELDRAIAERRWFSVSPAMTASRPRRASVRRMPRDRVVLESDGPYAKLNGRPTRPADVAEVIPQLASLWAMPRDAVRRQLADNFARLTERDQPPV